jgi:hypothetical protein
LENGAPREHRGAFWAALVALAIGFVVLGGATLDLGLVESRLGLAAREGLGPLGQIYGGWEPSLWPAQVVTSQLWARAEGGTPSSGAVRWPAAIAGIVIGLGLARRMAAMLGQRAGLFMGLCWFGTIALIDRSAGGSIDLIAGLGVVAAFDRILVRGSDVWAGVFAALAFLAGGWPPLALIALATVVIGKPASTLSFRLSWPPLIAATLWSAWALTMARAEVWAAALALPLTQPPAFTLALGVMALGLPWSPLALLVLSRRLREVWPEPARGMVVGWLQVAGACLLAGSLVPGLAGAALVPGLAGLAVAAAAVCEALWTESVAGSLATGVRRIFLALAFGLALVWVAIALGEGGYLAASVSFYRPVALLLVCLALVIGQVGLAAAWRGQPRWALGVLIAVAVCVKIAHWGVYVPEWNYRRSQGPWGRAIGQWVPPNWPIYTIHTWPADLAFATERPVRQLADARLLNYKSKARPHFVLLLPSELKNWPTSAPRLFVVRTFQDERGDERVLAHTAGSLAQARPAREGY